jgi:hypothetical protein
MPARSSVDFDGTPTSVCAFRNNHFRPQELGLDGCLGTFAANSDPMEAIYLMRCVMAGGRARRLGASQVIGRHTGLRPIRISNSEIISLQERDIGPSIDFVQAFFDRKVAK